MTVAIIVPVLRRPHRVVPLLRSIEEATPEPHRVLFVCSPGDDAEIDAIVDAGAECIVTPDSHQTGDYARKINLGYRETTEPLIFTAADDLHFHPGWLARAQAELTDRTGVIGTNDLTNRRTKRQHSTHSLVVRSYVDEWGTIDEPAKVLHEGYRHNWVDDELVATAVFRGMYVHAHDSHVEHLHPMRGKAPRDEVYELGLAGFEADRRTFQMRSRMWT